MKTSTPSRGKTTVHIQPSLTSPLIHKVLNKHKKLNQDKSTCPDGIPKHILCELSAEVAPAVSYVFQTSLDTGQITDD